MERRHETIEHTSDTGIRAWAPSLEALFEECAAAMFGVMYEQPMHPSKPTIDLHVAAETPDELLVAWLSELLFVAESGHLALHSFAVSEIGGGILHGTAGGVDMDDVELHGPPIKAVTYHRLDVGRSDGGWEATVIFDV